MMISRSTLAAYLGQAEDEQVITAAADEGEVVGVDETGVEEAPAGNGAGIQIGDTFVPWWMAAGAALHLWWFFLKEDG